MPLQRAVMMAAWVGALEVVLWHRFMGVRNENGPAAAQCTRLSGLIVRAGANAADSEVCPLLSAAPDRPCKGRAGRCCGRSGQPLEEKDVVVANYQNYGDNYRQYVLEVP